MMANYIPDNDEQDRMHTTLRIKAYLQAFRENEIHGGMVRGKVRMIKNKSGMIETIRKDMNPEVKGVCGCKRYTRSDGKRSWMIKFELWDALIGTVEMDMDEAKEYGTHMLAYYSNMHGLCLMYPEWEWTADEKIWLVYEG